MVNGAQTRTFLLWGVVLILAIGIGVALFVAGGPEEVAEPGMEGEAARTAAEPANGVTQEQAQGIERKIDEVLSDVDSQVEAKPEQAQAEVTQAVAEGEAVVEPGESSGEKQHTEAAIEPEPTMEIRAPEQQKTGYDPNDVEAVRHAILSGQYNRKITTEQVIAVAGEPDRVVEGQDGRQFLYSGSVFPSRYYFEGGVLVKAE